MTILQHETNLHKQVVLITGAARRIGADIARYLHSFGMNIVLHFNTSTKQATQLYQELDAQRSNSVLLLQANLSDTTIVPQLIQTTYSWQQRIDLLVNNASNYYPTPIESANETHWEDLMNVNLKMPFFLARHAAPLLKETRGNIINLVDINAERPLKNYPIYSIAKAGNAMMVKALARELAPEVRVNGIAPGLILWSEAEQKEYTQKSILNRIPLQRMGSTEDIVRTVLFLHRDAVYVTGQIIAVDGGRTIQQ
jgi:pteridine reductase